MIALNDRPRNVGLRAMRALSNAEIREKLRDPSGRASVFVEEKEHI